MGNASKKLAAKCTLLTKEEQKYVADTFKSASRNSDRIREDDLIVSGKLDAVSLEKYWGPMIDPRLTQYLTNFLFGSGPNKAAVCEFNRFAELYVHNVRGTVDERLKAAYECLGMEYNERTDVPYQLIREYCESIASTYIKIIKSSTTSRANKWLQKGFKTRASHVQALGEAIAASLSEDDNPKASYKANQLSRWVQSNVLLQEMTQAVFVNLYGIETSEGEEGGREGNSPSLLPAPIGIDVMPDYPAFIDIAHIVWINSQLPMKHQHKWRFLFSSHIHGESFSTMAGRIVDQGPSVLIIEDSNGHIFGGFASESWVQGAAFHGNDSAFLFTAAPKMRVYPGTSFNNHYQYMNQQTKTLPNGLMMGGQFEMAGIWVTADPFGEGSCADTCITFRGFKRPSKDAKFKIRSLEVWGVGEKPLSVKESEELEESSVLDKNPEAKAILELAGRTRHSEGIREPPPL